MTAPGILTLRDHFSKIDQDIDRIAFALSLRKDEPLLRHAEDLRELVGDIYMAYEDELKAIRGGKHFD